jgi:hypothetical protein
MMMDSMLISLAIASVISVGLLFLPAIIELKKPSDSGPRLIDGLFEQRFSRPKKNLVNIENESKMEYASGIEETTRGVKNAEA